MTESDFPASPHASFDLLSPEVVLDAVESAFDLRLDGSLWTYSSYVNRVYGVKTEAGLDYVVKFYRPGRWSPEAILEEHVFLADCVEAELPVVAPLSDREGQSLAILELEDEEAPTESFCFSLFPKRGGRGFDAEAEEDWLRLGTLVGRLHAVGRVREARYRLRLDPVLPRSYLNELLPLVHPEFRGEFDELCSSVLSSLEGSLGKQRLQRIHGDLHRGNILDRPGEGLLLIDFDDMLVGPAVQDLWLLLPDRAPACRRELALLMEGYSDFSALESESLSLIEALRFIRMLHFLAWRARQRFDRWFLREFPDWGSRSFWIKELEDLREQGRYIDAGPED